MPRIQFIASTQTEQFNPSVYFLCFLSALKIASQRKYRCECDSYQFSHDPDAKYVTENTTGTVLVMDEEKEDWFKFRRLVEQWQKERGARSSITETVVMPAYQEIIGMGEKAVPLLIAQLRSEGNEPDQWFWALRAITGENPVKPEDQGNFRKMSKAWLEWAKQNVW